MPIHDDMKQPRRNNQPYGQAVFGAPPPQESLDPQDAPYN